MEEEAPHVGNFMEESPGPLAGARLAPRQGPGSSATTSPDVDVLVRRSLGWGWTVAFYCPSSRLVAEASAGLLLLCGKRTQNASTSCVCCT